MKLADWFRAKKQEWFGRKEEQPAEVSAEASEKAKPAKKKSSSRKKTAETAVQPEKPQETETVEKAQETAETTLEWNPGGHFNEPEERMARAVRALLT